MEDVLTDAPPPSRFFQEDLDNFATPSPTLPPPSLLPTSNPNPNPSLLILLISPSSLSLLPSIPSKTPISSLSPPDPAINFYSLPSSTVLAAVEGRVPAERSKAVAKLIFNEFRPERLVVLDSIRGENYRGRLVVDEPMVFKLETRAEKGSGLVKGVEYLGSGSLVDGLGAAAMGECEMRRRKGTMVVTWPESGRGVVRVLRGLARDFLGLEVGDGDGDVKTKIKSSYWLESGLYT